MAPLEQRIAWQLSLVPVHWSPHQLFGGFSSRPQSVLQAVSVAYVAQAQLASVGLQATLSQQAQMASLEQVLRPQTRTRSSVAEHLLGRPVVSLVPLWQTWCQPLLQL